jgi:hypothetical protein
MAHLAETLITHDVAHQPFHTPDVARRVRAVDAASAGPWVIRPN